MRREQSPARKPSSIEDEWGTTTRVGYEDRPAYQPRKAAPTRKGNRFLRTIGGLMVVGGMAWITYVATSPNGLDTLLKPAMPSPPVLVLAGGLVLLLLEKLVK